MQHNLSESDYFTGFRASSKTVPRFRFRFDLVAENFGGEKGRLVSGCHHVIETPAADDDDDDGLMFQEPARVSKFHSPLPLPWIPRLRVKRRTLGRPCSATATTRKEGGHVERVHFQWHHGGVPR